MPGMPSAEEQLTLELINRLRADPAGEAARLIGSGDAGVADAIRYFGVSTAALGTQLAALAPVAPLAWNGNLSDAAEGHNAAMIAADQQSHQVPGEAGLGGRADAAGYTGWSYLAENVYAFADNPFHAHAGFVIDWGYDAEDFDGDTLRSDWQRRGDGMQDPAGHRINLMSASVDEIGVAIVRETSAATRVGDWVVTHDLGSRFGYRAQLLGVVIDDRDGDDFYDVGEGMGGIVVTLSGASGTFATTTWDTGGYQLVAPAGSYTATFSGGALGGIVVKSVTIGADNVKLDAERAEASTGNGDDRLVGTAAADRLDGGGGDDVLIGLGGGDTLIGGVGTDTASYADDAGGFFINLDTGRGYGNAAQGDTYDSIENLIGGGSSDFFIGTTGANRLDGGAGADRLVGSLGGDLLVGASGADTASYEDNWGAVFVNLTLGRGYGNAAEGDTYDGIENLLGGLMDDFFIGDAGANRLDGAMGADTLIGAEGADTFVFAYAPGAISAFGSANADRIVDFASGVDRIELAGSAFGGLAADALGAGVFALGSAATAAGQRLVYDAATGRLLFDADGSGGGAAVLVATFGEATHPALTAADFVVV